VTTHAYEVLLMLDPEQPEERQEEIVTRTRELIESRGGTIEKHDPWGRRKLAYEIGHKSEGTYHLLLFTSDADTLDELSRILKITDGVMRHMAVRRPEGKTTSPAETSSPAEAPTTDSTAPAEAA
jgi:small subunit ribosomal protein S6